MFLLRCCQPSDSTADHKYEVVPPAAAAGASDAKSPDEPKDGIPLTKRQRFLLQNNWKAIARDMEPAGAELFVKLLDNDPSLHKLFSFPDSIVSSPKEKQLRDETLRKHGQGVMQVFDQLISSIDQPDVFFGIINKYALSHSIKPSFKPEYFKLLSEPFLYSIRVCMGERYTDNMHEIYQVFIRLVLASIEQSTCQKIADSKTAAS